MILFISYDHLNTYDMKNLLNELKSLRMIGHIFILTAFVFFAASCEEESAIISDKSADIFLDGSPAPSDETILDITENSEYYEFMTALDYVDTELDAGLTDRFSVDTCQLTLFIPTDTAFFNLYEFFGNDVEGITDIDPELVLDVLLYHITHGRRASNSIIPKKNHRNIQTLLGVKFYINPDHSIDAYGNTANIIILDISASNGIIHVIDEVMLPMD